MSIRRVLVGNFADYTTAHGLASIKRAQSYCGKTMWVVFLLAAWAAMGYQVYVAINRYFQYQTTVAVQMTHNNSLMFPAVTVCNLNPIRLTQLTQLEWFNSMVTSYSSGVSSASEGWDKMSKKQPTTLTHEQQMRAFFYYSIFKHDVNVANMSHQMEDMLVECTFQGKQCFPSNFSKWQHATYGNCYTLFIPSGAYPSFVGPAYGLVLTLFTQDQTEYLQEISTAAGFRVTVHSAEYIPFPEDQGFTISPGYLTSVAFKQRYIHRQPMPYDNTDCGNQRKLMNRYLQMWIEDFYDKKLISEANYTNSACTKDCYQMYLMQDCNCSDPATITRRVIQGKNGKDGKPKPGQPPPEEPEPCDLSDEQTLNCTINATMKINAKGLCDYPVCMQPCDEFRIVTRITSSLWPLKSYFTDKAATWEARLDMSGGGDPLSNQGHDEARKHLAKVEVYFEDLNYESIVESAAMDVWALLSSVGGTLGLYGGLSFLTLVEFVELFAWILTKKQATVDVDHQEFNMRY